MIEKMRFPLAIRDLMMAESHEVDAAISLMSEEEFRSFYDRTSRSLWAYLARITGDPHQADDFLQEAYYRFYRAAAKYESESHRRNSLFQIATNLVRDAARRDRRYPQVSLEDENANVAPPASETPDPGREVAARMDLAKAMQQLDPAQRELLWLAYAQGASHQEISDVLGMRAISVRTMLLRARRKLAGYLEKGVEQ